MVTYIHQLSGWPALTWDHERLAPLLAEVRHQQGRLTGRMEALGFPLRTEANLQTLTQDVLKTSEIEGERLDTDQVRSSIARRLGLEIAGLVASDRNVEGIVEVMLDATRNYAAPLTRERLFAWHAALFPTGRSGMRKITTGAWRAHAAGPMQVVSGPVGREHIHYEAPEAARLDEEMTVFLAWFNKAEAIDPVLKAALAHFWFVTIHPFEDGNGRIARAIADMALARSERTAQRFYSMSAQIRLERDAYYDTLEAAQKGTLDVTVWIDWFLHCLARAMVGAQELLGAVLRKARFWNSPAAQSLNARQRTVINRLLDGFQGHMTSSKWAKLAKCSQDTAARDIQELVAHGIFKRNPGGGRSTSYSLVEPESVAD